MHVLEETAHAKSVGDGLASEIKNKVASNVKGGYSALPGTRNHVLLLAQLHPKPKGDEANKLGMWASKRIIYAYYSEEVLRTGSSHDFKTFAKSKSRRFRYGYNEVDTQANRGLLRIRQGFCACSSCHAPKFDFEACQFKALLGRTFFAECPPLLTAAGATTRTTEIPLFAATLKVGEVRAADISREDAEVEGAPFWLCYIKEPARQLLAPTVFAGVSFDEGWWVVPVQWLEFNGSVSAGKTKLRRYKLGQVHLISVHSLVRCDAVKLSEPAAVATTTAVAAADGAPVGRGRPKTVFVLPSEECSRLAQYTEIQEL